MHTTIVELDQDGYRDKRSLFTQLMEELPWNVTPSLDELMLFYETEYVKQAVLMNQAKEVLTYIKSNYKLGLITNGRTLIQYGKIDQLGIRDWFDFILVSEEAKVKKPDPLIYRMALDRLQLPAEQCIYIGDHPVNDVAGVGAIGMETIWMKVNQPWRDDIKAKPLHAIACLDELLEWL